MFGQPVLQVRTTKDKIGMVNGAGSGIGRACAIAVTAGFAVLKAFVALSLNDLLFPKSRLGIGCALP